MDKWRKFKQSLQSKSGLPGDEKTIVRRNKAFHVSLKWGVGISMGLYFVASWAMLRKNETYKYRFAGTRIMSRMAGRLGGLRIPSFLRQPLYSTFSKLYKVNLEEVKAPLIDFKTLKEFFTRELKPGARPIKEQYDNSILCSPADSTVLAYGVVQDGLIRCVKGHDYPVGELLYGKKRADDSLSKLFPSLEENKDLSLYYAVLYLSPSDYHRYHSPTSMLLKERTQVVGYLNPVMPSYLLSHKLGLKDNERVTVKGTWEQGEIALTYVGALNVGSISLHFDNTLQVNMADPYKSDYSLRKNYEAGIKQNSNQAGKINLARNSALMDLAHESSRLSKEFDKSDMVDKEIQEKRRQLTYIKVSASPNAGRLYLDNLNKILYFYDPKDETCLDFNIYNSYKATMEAVKVKEERYESASIAQSEKHFTETIDGIYLKKGAEMGMFNFGSTVVMIFTAPKDLEFAFKIKDKLKVGESIFSAKKKI